MEPGEICCETDRPLISVIEGEEYTLVDMYVLLRIIGNHIIDLEKRVNICYWKVTTKEVIANSAIARLNGWTVFMMKDIVISSVLSPSRFLHCSVVRNYARIM